MRPGSPVEAIHRPSARWSRRCRGGTSIDVDEGERLVCVTLSSPVVITVLAAIGFDVSATACAAAGGR